MILCFDLNRFTRQETCTLTYLATGKSGYYAVAIQIEDFKDSSSTSPFSSVPLQFLVHVLNTPCGSSPKFVSPTPESGTTLDLIIGVRFELNITA